MRGVGWIALGTMLSACGAAPQRDASANQVAAATQFPKIGEYHIVRDVTSGAVTNRYESDSQVDASSREKLLELVAGGGVDSPYCDDRQVTVSDDSFSIRQTCGSMAVETHGTYSDDSIDVTYERTVGGTAHTDRASYRLKD